MSFLLIFLEIIFNGDVKGPQVSVPLPDKMGLFIILATANLHNLNKFDLVLSNKK